MKMSDVFDLPLRVDGNSISDKDGIQVSPWGFEGSALDESAAHAINQHDQLTAINQELVEALESLIKGNHKLVFGLRENAEQAIKRANEITNEG